MVAKAGLRADLPWLSLRHAAGLSSAEHEGRPNLGYLAATRPPEPALPTGDVELAGWVARRGWRGAGRRGWAAALDEGRKLWRTKCAKASNGLRQDKPYLFNHSKRLGAAP